MRFAAAARGGTGVSAERDGTAGVPAPDAASGPPPRLLKSPPKVETLPPHIFSPAERGKIYRLRCFFDSLEIADEDSAEMTGAEAPSCAESSASGATNVGEGIPDDRCSHDANEGTASLLVSPRSSLTVAPHVRGSAAVKTDCSAGGPPDCDLPPPAPDDTAAGGESNGAEIAAMPATSSWLRWSFLVAGEASTAAAAAPIQQDKGKEKTQDKEEENVELKLYWEEVLWLEDDLILARYLRSYGWDVEEARKQLLRTLLWRRQQKPQHVSPNQVSSFARRGSVYRKGFDIHGRGVVYFKPGRDPCTGSDLFQRYVVYTLERALESLERERGVDQLVFIVDFSEWGFMQIARTEISRDIVSILNDHYTDVLAAVFIVNAPSYFDPLWRLVSLVVHPDTVKKVVFVNTKDGCRQTSRKTGGRNGAGGGSSTNRESCSGTYTRAEEDCASSSNSSQGETTSYNLMRELIPHPFLEQCVGGESSLDYDHDTYWQAEKEHFLRVSIHRRQQRQALQQAVRTRRQKLRQQQQYVATFSGNVPDPEACDATPAVLH